MSATQAPLQTSFAHAHIPLATEGFPSIMTAELTRQRECIRCKQFYRERENIGAWRCPMMHAHAYDHDAKVYPCCSLSTGCIAADHTENVVEPYPGCVSDYELTRGVPAYKLLVGNLKELQGWRQEACWFPSAADRQHAAAGKETAELFLLRWCLFGKPQ